MIEYGNTIDLMQGFSPAIIAKNRAKILGKNTLLQYKLPKVKTELNNDNRIEDDYDYPIRKDLLEEMFPRPLIDTNKEWYDQEIYQFRMQIQFNENEVKETDRNLFGAAFFLQERDNRPVSYGTDISAGYAYFFALQDNTEPEKHLLHPVISRDERLVSLKIPGSYTVFNNSILHFSIDSITDYSECIPVRATKQNISDTLNGRLIKLGDQNF